MDGREDAARDRREEEDDDDETGGEDCHRGRKTSTSLQQRGKERERRLERKREDKC